MIFIPWVNTVLDTVADQGVVDAHVAMAKESVSFTWSLKTKGKSQTAVEHRGLKTIHFTLGSIRKRKSQRVEAEQLEDIREKNIQFH